MRLTALMPPTGSGDNEPDLPGDSPFLLRSPKLNYWKITGRKSPRTMGTKATRKQEAMLTSNPNHNRVSILASDQQPRRRADDEVLRMLQEYRTSRRPELR